MARPAAGRSSCFCPAGPISASFRAWRSNLPDVPRRFERSLAALHVAALAVAIGAPAAFAVAVAPVALRVLPTRELAGAVNGAVLAAVCRLAEGAFAVLFATTWLLTSSGRRLRRVIVLRRLPVLAFFAAMVLERLVVPAMERLRNSASVVFQGGVPSGGGGMTFRRLHATSVWLLLLDLACGLALIAAVVGGRKENTDVGSLTRPFGPPSPASGEGSDVR